MSTSFAHGKQIVCPFCNNMGYLIKEKPRKKHETHTLRGIYKKQKIKYLKDSSRSGTSYSVGSPGAFYPHKNNWRNFIHKDYITGRVRAAYFRVKHNYRAVNRYRKNRQGGCPPFCYIGSPKAIITKINVTINGIEKTNNPPYLDRITEWVKNLEKKVDNILVKKVISEDDIGFLAYLRSLANHPTLRKDIVEWLNDVKQRELKKSEELTTRYRENKDRIVKSRKRTHNRTNLKSYLHI